MAPRLLYETESFALYVTVVGRLRNNVFVVQCKSSGQSVLFDAADQADDLIAIAKQLNVEFVLQTHGHWDHIGAISPMRAAGYRVGVGKGDAASLPEYDFFVEDGEIFTIGNIEIVAIATPGHTPGSICYAIDNADVIFSGDTLFEGGPGATHFPGGDHATILASIQEKLFACFPDNTIVFPGHGEPTTIGAEKTLMQIG